jgi:hypothetical protein
MRRFVRSFWGVLILGSTANIATIAVTGADAAASQLILIGYVAIAVVWMRIADLPAEWEAKARTGGGRSKGSR